MTTQKPPPCDCCKSPAQISLADSHICQACIDNWVAQAQAEALTPAQQMQRVVQLHHRQRQEPPCSEPPPSS